MIKPKTQLTSILTLCVEQHFHVQNVVSYVRCMIHVKKMETFGLTKL
jgi:hypothetical protein